MSWHLRNEAGTLLAAASFQVVPEVMEQRGVEDAGSQNPRRQLGREGEALRVICNRAPQ